MHPDQALFLRDFLLPQLKSESVVTARILSAIPSDQGDFKPEPKCFSAFGLCWHLVLCELWFVDAILHGEFSDPDPRPAVLKTCADIADWYQLEFAKRLPLLEALSGDQLTKPVDYIGLRNDPAVAYLNIAIRHSVHHRGQLSTYLRVRGAKVPAIYVESADEPGPPESAEPGPPPPAF